MMNQISEKSPPLRVLGGVVLVILMLFDTLLWALPAYMVACLACLIRIDWIHRCAVHVEASIVGCWVWGIKAALKISNTISWDISGLDGLSRNQWYFIICNHQSWTDIMVILLLFAGRIPFIRFFMKKELFDIPILGKTCRALDCISLERYSHEHFEENPDDRGRDIVTITESCRNLEDRPVSLLNFPEGTRFTPEKHASQNSPFRHLLAPKTGGCAAAISAMGKRIRVLLDVTIVYPTVQKRIIDFASGKIPRILVHVEHRGIPEHLLTGDYATDVQYRKNFHEWLNVLWHEKDDLIEHVYEQEKVQG
ncbi:MAG: acetyltransferase [Desulfomonilia bacterium]